MIRRRLSFCFLFLVIFVMLLNLLSASLSSEGARELVFVRPDNLSYRLDLIDDLVALNDLKKAKNEAVLAAGFFPASLEVERRIEEIEWLIRQPDQIVKDVSFWENVVRGRSNYRDAYLRLAVLYWQIYREGEAKIAILKAIELDPNYAPSRELWLRVSGS